MGPFSQLHSVLKCVETQWKHNVTICLICALRQPKWPHPNSLWSLHVLAVVKWTGLQILQIWAHLTGQAQTGCTRHAKSSSKLHFLEKIICLIETKPFINMWGQSFFFSFCCLAWRRTVRCDVWRRHTVTTNRLQFKWMWRNIPPIWTSGFSNVSQQPQP